jgi:sugar lactone lactonase YvrE
VSLLSTPEPVAAVTARPHTLLEGPRFGPAGSLLYSDVIAGGVFCCSADGEVAEILPGRRGIGGIVAHADGGWVISGRSLVHLQAGGGQRELRSDAGVPGYNDLGAGPGGELLAGELRYRPMSDDEPREGRLLAIAPGGEVRALSDEVRWPNGIGLAPDGATVYVSDYARRHVLAVPFAGGGASVFATSPRGSADGLAVDADGGVWVALGEGGAVARFDAGGELSELIELPAGFVSSISFGGEEMRDVLISTADNRERPELGGTLLRARSEVPGVPLAPVAV